MNDCLFCKIIAGEIPSEKVFENDSVYAFKDISPVAPVHVLVIPKVHIDSPNDINQENGAYITEVFLAIKEITRELGIAEDGYRIVANCNDFGGQTVHHLHFHIVGGKELGWPPFNERI